MATKLGKLLVDPISGTASTKTQKVTSWVPSPGNRSDITQNILYTATKPGYTDITFTASYIIPGIGKETRSAHEEWITTDIVGDTRLYYVPEYNRWINGYPYYAWTATDEFEAGHEAHQIYYTDKPFNTITVNTHIVSINSSNQVTQEGDCLSKKTSGPSTPYIYDSALTGGSIWFSSNEPKLSWSGAASTINNFTLSNTATIRVWSDAQNDWVSSTITNNTAIPSDPGATGRYFCCLSYTCSANTSSADLSGHIVINGDSPVWVIEIEQSAFNLEVTNSDSFNIPLETYSTTTVNTDRPNWTSEVSA